MRADQAGKPIRVVIADDHGLVRAGLRMLLQAEPDIEVVGEAKDGAQAYALALALRPAVMLADISMPPPDGIELARMLCRETPEVRTILVTMHEDKGMLADGLGAGAAGYVLKFSGPTELLAAVHAVAAGQRYVDTHMGGQGPNGDGRG